MNKPWCVRCSTPVGDRLTCQECEPHLRIPDPIPYQLILTGLIEALTAAIDLLDQYEAPRKSQCGTSSVTRNACERVLRHAKARIANKEISE